MAKSKQLTNRKSKPIAPNLRRAVGLERERMVRNLLVKDSLDLEEIAAVMDLPIKQVRKIYKTICDKWEASEAYSGKKALIRRLEQLEDIRRESLKGWERSTEDDVEEISTTKQEKCPSCKGKGEDKEGNFCERCDGEGFLELKVKTKKVRGQAGNPSFIKEMREAVKLSSVLEGHSPTKKVEHSHSGQIAHAHAHIEISDDNKFKDAPPELILEYKSLMSKFDDSKKEGDGEVIDVPCIEAEIVEDDDE